MANLAEIATQLEKPFALEDIDFLPKGQFEKDGKVMVMGLPYADPRVYQDRLNAVCPGEWTSQAVVTVAGNKIITLVTVTICGVAHTDIGEASLDGPTKENAGTESFAQGFKRACSQVGLGRYLYALDKAYLPYDKQRKKVPLSPAELRNEVRKLYAKAGIVSGPMPVEKPAQEATHAARPAQTATVSEKPAQPSKPDRAATNAPLVPDAVRNLKSQAVDAGIVHNLAEWMAYKESVLKKQVKDSELDEQQIKTLRAALDIDKQAQKAS